MNYETKTNILLYLVFVSLGLGLLSACGGFPTTETPKPIATPSQPPPGSRIVNGSYLVGPDQAMVGGTYESAPPEGGSFYRCTWSLWDFANNNIAYASSTDGGSTVTVSDGQNFQTSGCNEWKRVR